jgi:hypothetical protein
MANMVKNNGGVMDQVVEEDTSEIFTELGDQI